MAKYSEEAKRLWPYLIKKVEKVSGIGNTGGGSSGSVGVGGAPSPHSLDGAHHTGTITNAQGPQFLLTDGTRTLTGNLAVSGGVTIDGVDLSAHVADPNAHHDAATSGNAAISLTGQAISAVVASSGGLQITGTGLAIDLDTTPGLVLNAGGIKVLLDPTASGLQLTSGLALADSIAGAGLGIASKVLAVNVGDGMEIATDAVAIDLATNSGLTFSSGDLALGTPTVVSAVSINNVTTNTHVHAVTASSNVGTSAPGVDMLLKSTSTGGLTLGSLTVTGAATVDQGLTAGNTGFQVAYHTHDYNHVHVVINPGAGGGWVPDEQFGLDIDDNLLVRGWIVGKHAIQIDSATAIFHFDGPDRVGDLSGQDRGHMGQVPTSINSVTFAPGKFGKAVQTPVATTNLITNPSFETGAAGWNNYSTGFPTGTRTRVTSEAYAGSYSYELSKTAGGAGDRWGIDTAIASIVSGTAYTISCWVYIPIAAGGSQTFTIETSGAFPGGSTSQVGPTEGWVRIVRTVTASSSGNGFITLYISSANQMTVYLDAIQVEALAYATAYCDGTLGTGHSWSGTAHASSSARTTAVLYYNTAAVLYQNKGSVMAWVNPTQNSINQMVFYHWTSGTGMIYIRANAAGVWGYAFGGTEIATATAVTANTWAHVALTWDDDAVNFYVDGTLVDTDTLGPWVAALNTAFAIGREWGGTGNQNFSGLIDDVVILSRAATADEVRAIVESNAPVFAETSTWHWRSARNRIYADSEGLWGIGASGQTILGLYAGDEENPSATKSWGGINMQEGDLVIGDASRGASMFWDNNWGSLYIGNGGASSSQLLLDSTDIRMYANSVVRLHLTGSGNLRLYDAAATERFAVGSTGIMTIKDSGGNAVFTFDSSTGAEFTKALTLGTSGGIYQGTGTFGTPTTGLKIWRDSNIGRIGGYNSGTLQWGADTDGRLYAGAGNVVIDAAGISVEVGSTPIDDGDEFSFPNSYSLISSGGLRVGALSGAGTGHVALAASPATGESQLYLMANPLDVVWGAGAVWPQIAMDAGNTAGSVITLDGQDIIIGHSTVNPTEIFLRGLVNTSNATFGDVYGDIISGDVLRATADPGGVASTITFTGSNNAAANSTGTGTVKMKGATSRDSTGFIKIYVGTTAYYIPYWSNYTG